MIRSNVADIMPENQQKKGKDLLYIDDRPTSQSIGDVFIAVQ